MKKVVVSTGISVVVLWCLALALYLISKFKEQVTFYLNTGIDDVNVMYLYSSLMLIGVTVVLFAVYFIYRWSKENKKEKISLFKFIFTEINAASDDEREIEISRKSTIASVKVMDVVLILGAFCLPSFGRTFVSMEIMLIYVIICITIRELFYLYKWYRLY